MYNKKKIGEENWHKYIVLPSKSRTVIFLKILERGESIRRKRRAQFFEENLIGNAPITHAAF